MTQRSRRQGADADRRLRAAAYALQVRLHDRASYRLWSRIDCCRREVQHQCSVTGQNIVAVQGLRPLVWHGVMRPGIDLDRDAGIVDPSVWRRQPLAPKRDEGGIPQTPGNTEVVRTISRSCASGADRTPSVTSSRACRSSALPRRVPLSSSSRRHCTVVSRRWTASATNARTSRRSLDILAVSAAARATETTLTGPCRTALSSSRWVRRTTR
jgi:hypothetical protein